MPRYHLLWCTAPSLTHRNPEVRTAVYQAIAERCRHEEWTLLACEVRPDWVHLHVDLAAETVPGYVMLEAKRLATTVLQEAYPLLRAQEGLWTPGGLISTQTRLCDCTVKEYVERQGKRYCPCPRAQD